MTNGQVAPGNAAEIDGVEQERPDVDILPAGIGGDLLWAIIDFAVPGGPQTRVGWRASTRSARVEASSLGRSV